MYEKCVISEQDCTNLQNILKISSHVRQHGNNIYLYLSDSRQSPLQTKIETSIGSQALFFLFSMAYLINENLYVNISSSSDQLSKFKELK